jgi:hypothetical protein
MIDAKDDYIAGRIGENSERNAVGKDIQQLTGNQVHIAVERMAQASERGTDQISELSRQIATLADDVTALTRALIGDQRYGSTGLVQKVAELAETGKQRERWRIVSTWLLVVTVIMQALQWWLLYRVYDLYWIIFQSVNGG